MVFFCTSRRGWGWNAFLKEANDGDGAKVPGWLRGYVTYGLPAVVILLFVLGYIQKFG